MTTASRGPITTDNKGVDNNAYPKPVSDWTAPATPAIEMIASKVPHPTHRSYDLGLRGSTFPPVVAWARQWGAR